MNFWKSAGLASALLIGLAACSPGEDVAQPVDSEAAAPEIAEAAVFTVLVGGTAIGQMEVSTREDGYTVDFEFRNNGRGPTLSETVTLDGTCQRVRNVEVHGRKPDAAEGRRGV